MKIIETRILDLELIEPKVFGDERDFFLEAWNMLGLSIERSAE